MTNKADKKQTIGLVAMLAVSAVLVFAGEPIRKATTGGAPEVSAKLNDGSYISEIKLADESKSIVNMTVEGGAVKDLSWDIENPDGTTKSELSKTGAYVMTETGLKWHEQSELLSDYVIANKTDDKIILNEEGKIDGELDGLSGVSIEVSDFKTGVEDCFKQAESAS